MGHIYAHAACTISATASRNSEDGLFFDRDPLEIVPRLIASNFRHDATWLEGKDDRLRMSGQYMCDLDRLAEKCIEGAPLNARAWVSQERQLSRRIMHFTGRQLFWECYSGTACETYPQSIPRSAATDVGLAPTLLKLKLHEMRYKEVNTTDASWASRIATSCIDYALYRVWSRFRINYSQCGLSRDSDKLVALHDIAQEVSKVAGDEPRCWTLERPYHSRSLLVQMPIWQYDICC
jgi:hypothetical protein